LLEDAAGVFSAFGSLSLRELYHLLDLSVLVVSGDTGPLHIAAATRTPLVALYGPTDPLRTGPWPPGRAEVITAPGCGQCRMPHCSRGCMKLLYPCAVTQTVMSIRSAAQQAIRA
jgi:ADP-heptose:LPS heptosyltransferase